jgi:hypothetical protein
MKDLIIKNWVPTPLYPVKVLVIAENCPDECTYFYRSLSNNIKPKGANNLLNNVAKTFNIDKDSELDKLKSFLDKGFFLIDSYLDGSIWDETTKHHDIKELHEVILRLNPAQIIFTCKRSNKKILDLLINYEKSLEGEKLKIVTNNTIKDKSKNPFVFSSISNRAYALFNQEIKDALINKRLKF